VAFLTVAKWRPISNVVNTAEITLRRASWVHLMLTPVRDLKRMFYTYVLRSEKEGRWYTGSTENLRKRFQEHNNGKVISTKNRRPFKLIYYEACINKQDAKLREKYLKSGMGKRYLKNRMERFLSLTGLTPLEMLIS